MIKRIVEISQAKSFLSVRLGQLVIEQDKKQVGQIPCEDIGVLLVSHSGVVYTHSVFTELLKNNAAIVLCGRDYMPAGMFMPLESNNIQSERFASQAKASRALKKRLWKQLVQAKIAHQAANVKDNTAAYKKLRAMIRQVRSGDTSNVESHASKVYWGAFLEDEGFRRDKDGGGVNVLLNYGYMVLRAAVARALCSAGLLCTLGVHHCNKYNAFCLADDVMEPFRGYVEKQVRQICRNSGNETPQLDQHNKARLIEVLYSEIQVGSFKGPLMVGLHRTCASLQRCFAGEDKRIVLPKL